MQNYKKKTTHEVWRVIKVKKKLFALEGADLSDQVVGCVAHGEIFFESDGYAGDRGLRQIRP